MIDFTLYTANCCGDSSNCVYPNKAHITDSASFVAAIQSWTGLPAPAIKVVVDLGLYFVNFRAQKRFIFRD